MNEVLEVVVFSAAMSVLVGVCLWLMYLQSDSCRARRPEDLPSTFPGCVARWWNDARREVRGARAGLPVPGSWTIPGRVAVWAATATNEIRSERVNQPIGKVQDK